MADLQKSDAIWLRFWIRFLFVVSMFRFLDFVSRRFGDEKRTTFDARDPRGNLDTADEGGVRLSGVQIGVNTTAGGLIIVRVTGAGDPRTVTLYMATGGGAGDRICAGTANAGATATLAALNGSGVTGEFDVDASVVEDTDDTFTLFVQQDWRLAAENLFDGSDDDGEDAKSAQSVANTLDQIEALVLDARALTVTLLSRIMVADDGNARAWGSKFLREVFTSLLNERGTVDGSGLVAQVRTGALPSLLQASIDETTGSTQSVIRRVVAAAAAVEDTNNDGQGAIASHTPEAQMPTGDVVIRCTAGKEQGLPTAAQREQFSVEFASDEDDRTKTYSQPLTLGAAYKGEDGFGGALGVTLTRQLTKTGDNSHLHLATVTSGFATAGESLLNTSSGIVYWEITADGTNRGVDFYKSESYDAGDRIASAPPVAVSTAFAAAAVEGSGFSMTGTMGSAPVAGTQGSIDLNFYSTLNSSGRPDELRIAVTLTEEGEISRLLARMPIQRSNGFRLNGVAAAAELISDDYVKRNTFRDLSGEDA